MRNILSAAAPMIGMVGKSVLQGKRDVKSIFVRSVFVGQEYVRQEYIR